MSLEKLKHLLKDGKALTIGADETIKKIKLGKVKTIFISKDCKPLIKENILNYKKNGDLEVYELEISSSDIGALCKKQFSISVLSY